MKEEIPRCDSCNNLTKPDIVFFGEQLPMRFFTAVQNDLPKCDLLIIMGTSLVVHPFASMIDRVTFVTIEEPIYVLTISDSRTYLGNDTDTHTIG